MSVSAHSETMPLEDYLAQGGKLKGDPRAARNAAGPKLAQECRS